MIPSHEASIVPRFHHCVLVRFHQLRFYLDVGTITERQFPPHSHHFSRYSPLLTRARFLPTWQAWICGPSPFSRSSSSRIWIGWRSCGCDYANLILSNVSVRNMFIRGDTKYLWGSAIHKLNEPMLQISFLPGPAWGPDGTWTSLFRRTIGLTEPNQTNSDTSANFIYHFLYKIRAQKALYGRYGGQGRGKVE